MRANLDRSFINLVRNHIQTVLSIVSAHTKEYRISVVRSFSFTWILLHSFVHERDEKEVVECSIVVIGYTHYKAPQWEIFTVLYTITRDEVIEQQKFLIFFFFFLYQRFFFFSPFASCVRWVCLHKAKNARLCWLFSLPYRPRQITSGLLTSFNNTAHIIE